MIHAAKPSKLAQQDAKWGYLFIAPQFVGILVFTVFPVFFSLYISFFKWDMINDPVFYNTRNWVKILSKPEFWRIMWNTCSYVLMYVPMSIVTGLLLALLINREFRGVTLYRSAFFLPNITSSVAISVIWSFLLQKDNGLVNMALALVGITGPDWLHSRDWSMFAIAIVATWHSMGYNMIVLLAGIKGIDPSYYEAAKVDGSSKLHSFLHITLPLLTPTLFFMVCTGLINSFQMFNEAYMLTGGGPGTATTTLVFKIYNLAFRFWKMGEAAVWSWGLFICVLAITLLQFKAQNKWVNYDA